ncbi:MAG: DUF1878 domain-containing protein [Eubacteriales bacterium]|nr:DUF1878 domain-containing protein [Eubacteriales bacterium]
MNIEERLDFLEFRQDLLFEGKESDHFIYESNITRNQYKALMDLMDEYRDKIDRGEKVHHGTFEDKVYQLIPEKYGDYHFCEIFTQLLKEENRWEEVFQTLYGDMPKFKNL